MHGIYLEGIAYQKTSIYLQDLWEVGEIPKRITWNKTYNQISFINRSSISILYLLSNIFQLCDENL